MYARPQEYAAQVNTINQPFQVTVETVTDAKVKEPQPNLHIQQIRGMAQFKHLSNEMLRLMDLQHMKG